MRHALLLVLVGCATTGTNPHDMSASAHETAATGEDQLAIAWASADRDEMTKHMRIAAEHRAASQALRDAEAVACAGVSEEDRAMSPLEHRADIVRVERKMIGARSPHLFGAVVTLRAVPGLTAPALDKLVRCHIARGAVLGHDVPEMPTCPLVLRDVEASVSAGNGTLRVEVTSWTPEVANEIWRRVSLEAKEAR